MNLAQLLSASGFDQRMSRCKVHLAVPHAGEDPLDKFLAEQFNAWQEWQTKNNFQRPHVISLISMPERDQWLFAGVFDSHEFKFVKDRGLYRYRLTQREETATLIGRLVVNFKRSGRQSYLCAENWMDRMLVKEIRSAKLKAAEFCGYRFVTLSKSQLDVIVFHNEPTWRSALTSVAGVYVIADRSTGKLYVGSATGEGGIWARWCSYAHSGHGGNKELSDLLSAQGEMHAEFFQFGILEIADPLASREHVLARESFWKELLLTRSFGHNSN